MSRRLLRVPVMPLASGELVLGEAESRYVHKVHRLAAGDVFLAFDPVQRVQAEVRIRELGRRVRGMASELVAVPAPSHDLTLVYALAKGEKLELVVRDATALGATRVLLAASRRSVVQLDAGRGAERLKRLTLAAVESARQSGRGDLPVIEGPLALPAALERAGGDDSLKLLLHPHADQPIARALAAWTPGRAVVVAVGPEGGFSPDELELAERSGFEAISLGPLTLRTETAAVAALASVATRLWAGT